MPQLSGSEVQRSFSGLQNGGLGIYFVNIQILYMMCPYFTKLQICVCVCVCGLANISLQA
jgi:hypothetical protein